MGLSIGGAAPLDKDYLARLKAVHDRYEPALFSEHLAWSTQLPDLLPLPYTDETLRLVSEHMQNVLGRTMLLENPSAYLTFETSTMSELDFLSEIVRRTGCGLLLDINNVFVSAGIRDMARKPISTTSRSLRLGNSSRRTCARP